MHMMAYNVFHDFAAHTCERNWAVVHCLAFISFLEDWGHLGCLPVLRQMPAVQEFLEDGRKAWRDLVSKLLQYSAWDVVGA